MFQIYMSLVDLFQWHTISETNILHIYMLVQVIFMEESPCPYSTGTGIYCVNIVY